MYRKPPKTRPLFRINHVRVCSPAQPPTCLHLQWQLTIDLDTCHRYRGNHMSLLLLTRMWKRAAASGPLEAATSMTKTRVQSYQNLLFPSFLFPLFHMTVGTREPCESSRRGNADAEIDLITRYKHTEHRFIVTYFG